MLYTVLGINDQEGARRLVRALLADPLGAEAEWESVLVDSRHGDKSLLIRYCFCVGLMQDADWYEIWRGCQS